MKNNYFILTGIFLIAGSLLTGCNNNREKAETAEVNGKDTKEELKDAQAQYEKEWQQFKSDVELKLAANEKRIIELKAEIKAGSGKFKSIYDKEVARMEQNNMELREKLRNYSYEGKDGWEKFKTELNREADIIGNAINDLFTKEN